MSRPRTMDGRKLLSLPADLKADVENYRFERRISTESEAFRRLIRAGLDAERNAESSGTREASGGVGAKETVDPTAGTQFD